MIDPQVLLAVDSAVALPIDLELVGRRGRRNCRSLERPYPSNAPLADRAGDHHGVGRWTDDACAQALVRPDPRIDAEPVVPDRCRVAGHRESGVPALPGRPQRRKEVPHPGATDSLRQVLEHHSGETLAIVVPVHGRRHEAERGRRPARLMVLDRSDQHRVVALRQSVVSPW
jgi:hypothetical protein